MTDKPETVADVLKDERNKLDAISFWDDEERAVSEVLDRIERAMAASAVPYRWLVGDEAFHSEAEAIEAIRQWGPSDAIATPVYAHAPPAVPIESQPDEVVRKTMEHMLRSGMVKIECMPEQDMRVPVESLGRDADYPECSGDPASCPENEGYGCCKPNPPPASVPDGAQQIRIVAKRNLQRLIELDSRDKDLMLKCLEELS